MNTAQLSRPKVINLGSSSDKEIVPALRSWGVHQIDLTRSSSWSCPECDNCDIITREGYAEGLVGFTTNQFGRLSAVGCIVMCCTKCATNYRMHITRDTLMTLMIDLKLWPSEGVVPGFEFQR